MVFSHSMISKVCGLIVSASLFAFVSCAPVPNSYSTPAYTPVYSVYQPPVVVNFDDYHYHGDHHHHHDDDQRTHYHPENRWDKIAYGTANKNLSSQDIQNINQLGNLPTKKTTTKKK